MLRHHGEHKNPGATKLSDNGKSHKEVDTWLRTEWAFRGVFNAEPTVGQKQATTPLPSADTLALSVTRMGLAGRATTVMVKERCY